MATPFRDGKLNESEAAKLAAFLVDVQGNDGLVINGTTGESPTLTHDEKIRLLKIAIDTVGDRAAVVFGAGTFNTQESIDLAKEGEAAGAHGIMLVNPYYNRPGQEGLYAHFSAVAKETGLPVLLYNIQPRSAINLETPTLLRLAEIPNIVGVKEASGNVMQISDVRRLAPEGFRVYSGDDALTLPILSLGGHGVVSVTGHVIGRLIKEMVEVFATDPRRAAEIHHRTTPITKALFSAPNPVPVKYALSLHGLDTVEVRLPLVNLTAAEETLIRKEMSDLGLISA